MRIIAGEKRGTLLFSPKDERVRPTYDRVKEAVFGRLQFELRDKIVYDAFAGSGALGLEALSRGAKFCCFSDIDRDSCETVRRNIEKLGYEKKARLLQNDCFSAIKVFSKTTKFDIVFIDPPYASGLYKGCVETLIQSGALQKGALIAAESDAQMEFDISGIEVKAVKKYGRAYMTYMVYNYE